MFGLVDIDSDELFVLSKTDVTRGHSYKFYIPQSRIDVNKYSFSRRVITLRASEAAAQCIVIGPVCGFVCVSGSITMITRNCVHRSSPYSVCR